MRNGRMFARPTLAQAINANAGSASHGATERPTLALAARGWATPRATDGAKGGPNQRGSAGDPMLPSMAAQWATPNVPNGGRSVSADIVASRGKTENGKRQVGLESETKHWAPPRASMATNGTDSGSASRQAQGANPGLKDQASQWATPTSSDNSNRTTKMAPSHGNGHGKVLAGQACTWPTPVASDDGAKVTLTAHQPGLIGAVASFSHPVLSTIDGRELSPTARTLRPRLNPAFACWLMGWPFWWTNPGITNSVRSEMALFRSKLQQHLWHFFGAPAFACAGIGDE